MLRYRLFIPMIFICCFLFGQTRTQLSLTEAYQLFEARYPVLQNNNLLQQINQKELELLDIAKRPTIYWNANGQVQSESTSLDSDGAQLPFEIDQPLVSVRTFLEANYNILDGGVNEAQKKLKTATLLADEQSLEVQRFALRNRLNSIFLNTELLRQQRLLLDISLDDLTTRKQNITAGVEEGIILESEMIQLEVKQLELEAQQQNLDYSISGLIRSVEDLTGTSLSNDVVFLFPELPSLQEVPEIIRPEQKLYQFQREAILAQSDMVEAQKKPKLSAFTQIGVGYPNPLNILDNNIAPFGVIGAKFSWQVTDWSKSKLEKEILSLQAQQIQNAESTFEFNLQTQEANYQAEVDRLNNQVEQDKKIAALQAKILRQLAAQLDEGVITSADYITQVNAELTARQNLSIHQTELLKLQLEFLNERGGVW